MTNNFNKKHGLAFTLLLILENNSQAGTLLIYFFLLLFILPYYVSVSTQMNWLSKTCYTDLVFNMPFLSLYQEYCFNNEDLATLYGTIASKSLRFCFIMVKCNADRLSLKR